MTSQHHSPAERGIALLMAIMAMLVVSTLAVALVMGSSLETTMAANFQRGIEAQYAAEAAVARAASDALDEADWSSLVDGRVSSSFVDGPSSGERALGDGTTIDLAEVANRANCGHPEPCRDAELVMVRAERPWGRNNPSWQLYGHGRFDDLTGNTGAGAAIYLVILVADDPAENDDRPAVDGGAPVTGEAENAGTDVLVLRAEAFGSRGSYARIDATLARDGGIVAMRQIR